MAEVLVLGGGLAGLSAARALGTDAHLLEATDRLGGLARTDVVDGFWFDWTGHWLHVRTDIWRRWLDERLPGGLLHIQRQARIHSHGVWTAFPFQVNTYGLPPAVVADCVRGFVAATLGPEGAELRAREPRTFHEFVLRHLGEGIGRHFMEPYNRKLYTVDPSELSAEWGGRFVPRPSLQEVIDGAVGIERSGVGYNASFVYPRQGGIETIPRLLAQELRGPVSLGAAVVRIETRARRVHLADGRTLPYTSLIHTLPLKTLVALLDPCPPALKEAASRLRAVSVTCVEVGVRGSPRIPFHWAYFPAPEVPFYRVGSPSQVHAGLAPPGHTSYAVEFAHPPGPIDTSALRSQAIDGLHRVGVLDPADVVLSRVRTIPTAYVIVDHACAEARRTILGTLESEGIVSAGRYGQWEYSGMEDALVSGEAAAERVRRSSDEGSRSRLSVG